MSTCSRLLLTFATVVLGTSLSGFAAEAKTVCKSAKDAKQERTVEVVYPESGKKVPCEVRYAKEAGAEAKVLFSAKVQENYCEPKATEFVAKLKGMGLECSGD